MRRRQLLTLLGGTTLAWPRATSAQPPEKVYRVGLLGPGGSDAGPFQASLIRGLAGHGYAIGKNLAFEGRGAAGQPDRLPQLVADLVASNVNATIALREPADFNAAFAAMNRDMPDAILMVSDPLTNLNRKVVFEFAAAHRLPAIYEYDFIARDGGLMSYGVDLDESFDLLGGLVDHILKGTKPADLPFEQPTRFVFALKLKTAKSLGFEIPASLLARADEVIE